MNENLPIYFVDIETVRATDKLDNSPLREMFMKRIKADFEKNKVPAPINTEQASMMPFIYQEYYEQHAALKAEFGKIACICIGRLLNGKFHIKICCGSDEKKVMTEAGESLSKAVALCAHNGLDFDYPFWTRRCIINNLPIPQILKTSGKKTWELQDQLLDTMKMWSGTEWNYRVSLELLTEVLGLPTPKGDMNGAMVGEAYWKAMSMTQAKDELPFDFEERKNAHFIKIGKYCAGDVFADANVYCRMKGLELITDDQIVYA